MKEYSFTINGHNYNVSVNSVNASGAAVCVNGKDYAVEFSDKENGAPRNTAGDVGISTSSTTPASQTQAATASSGGSARAVTSPLPGILVELCVSSGQSVRAGDKLAVLEAMKMENDILAECDGKVGRIAVAKGDSVLEGTVIMEIE